MLCSIGPTPKGARQTSGCDAAHVLLRSMVGRWWGARRDECIKHLGSLVKRREGVGAGVVRVWRGAGVAYAWRVALASLPVSARWVAIAPPRRAADVRQWGAPCVRVRGAACA